MLRILSRAMILKQNYASVCGFSCEGRLVVGTKSLSSSIVWQGALGDEEFHLVRWQCRPHLLPPTRFFNPPQWDGLFLIFPSRRLVNACGTWQKRRQFCDAESKKIYVFFYYSQIENYLSLSIIIESLCRDRVYTLFVFNFPGPRSRFMFVQPGMASLIEKYFSIQAVLEWARNNERKLFEKIYLCYSANDPSVNKMHSPFIFNSAKWKSAILSLHIYIFCIE